MNVDLSAIRKNTVPVGQYIENLEQPFHDIFLEGKQTYRINAEVISHIRRIASNCATGVFGSMAQRLRSKHPGSRTNIWSYWIRSQSIRRLEERP